MEAAARLIAAPPPIDLMLKAMPPCRSSKASACCPAICALPARHGRGRPARLCARADGGCRTSPPPCPRGCSARARAAPSLDLCAAPGGKTMQLAAAGWAVTALDVSESRLARLSENLARTGLAAELVAADVMAWAPAAPVDAILLDAPCSATGIFRRHPDVLHRVAAAGDRRAGRGAAGDAAARRRLAEAGRQPRLLGLLARARGGRGRSPMPSSPDAATMS